MGWHGALRWLPLAAFNRSNTEGILSDRFAFMFCDARALWFPLPREDHAARVKDGRFVSLPLRRTRILGKDTYGFQSDDRDLLGRVWSGATSPSQGLIKLAGPDQQTIEARGTVLFQDREGSFWLGTEGLGLYRFRKREIETLSVAQGLAAPNVYPLYQSTDGAVWIGSWPGGLCRYKGGKVTTFTAANGWSLREFQQLRTTAKEVCGSRLEGEFTAWRKAGSRRWISGASVEKGEGDLSGSTGQYVVWLLGRLAAAFARRCARCACLRRTMDYLHD